MMPVNTRKVRISKLQEQDYDEYVRLATPAQRLKMMWQLALDAWAFKGEPIAESRLPRHIVRVLRRAS